MLCFFFLLKTTSNFFCWISFKLFLWAICNQEDIDIVSNLLTFEDVFRDDLLMYIRNNADPS